MKQESGGASGAIKLLGKRMWGVALGVRDSLSY